MTIEVSTTCNILESFDDVVGQVNSAKWCRAMKGEMTSINKLKTWELVSFLLGQKSVQTNWYFDAKLECEGNMVRRKMRLVARRLTHMEGNDFLNVYVRAARYTTIRLLLCVSATMKHVRRVLDVENTFLKASLKETIYVSQLHGSGRHGKKD